MATTNGARKGASKIEGAEEACRDPRGAAHKAGKQAGRKDRTQGNQGNKRQEPENRAWQEEHRQANQRRPQGRAKTKHGASTRGETGNRCKESRGERPRKRSRGRKKDSKGRWAGRKKRKERTEEKAAENRQAEQGERKHQTKRGGG